MNLVRSLHRRSQTPRGPASPASGDDLSSIEFYHLLQKCSAWFYEHLLIELSGPFSSNSRPAANDQPELKFSIVGLLSLSKFAFN